MLRWQAPYLAAALALLLVLAPTPVTALEGGAISCELCLAGLDVVTALLEANVTESKIFDVIIEFCEKHHLYPSDVCSGAVETFGPEFIIIATQLKSTDTICDYFGACNLTGTAVPPRIASSAAFESFVRAQKQQKPLLPSLSSSSFAKANSPGRTGVVASGPVRPGFMFHVSDLHVDPLYRVGTNTSCGRPLCCERQWGTGDALTFGNFACDAPPVLLDEMLKAMVAVNATPDYILFTGDSPPHNVWAQSTEFNMNVSQYIMQRIQFYFPTTPLLYSIGNHEFFPVSQDEYPPADAATFAELAEFFGQALQPGALQTFLHMGFYAQQLSDTLLFVSLNTAPADNANFWNILEGNPAAYDPGHQLEWLNQTLALAAAAGQNVWLACHVPLGDRGIFDGYTWRVNQLIQLYGNVIASFHGHTHDDQFRVLLDANEQAYSIQFIAPSLTPLGGRNPSFRYVTFDQNTGLLLDYHQYMADLAQATNSTAPPWVVEYSACEAYNMTDLSAASYADMWLRMGQDAALLQKYCNNYFVSGPQAAECTADFQTNLYCSSGNALSSEVHLCIKNRSKPRSL